MATRTPKQIQRLKELVVVLRSGKYQQAPRKLRTDETHFCCLGVACDISGLGKWRESFGEYRYHLPSGERGASLMPYDVETYYGIRGTGPLSQPVEFNGETMDCLTGLNDIGAPFSLIADVIEEQFIGQVVEPE